MYIKHNQNSHRGFTFIEILVTITIIILLSSMAVVTYRQFTAQSRDARRKADLESVRAALEMYKSVNNLYPGIGAVAPGTSNTSALVSSVSLLSTYMSSLPTDPKPPTGCGYLYVVDSTWKSYTLFTKLETTTSSEVTKVKPAPLTVVGSTSDNITYTVTSGTCNGQVFNYWVNNP
ncbi:prepilin-type N-terminal cleavage/methylation domain-containing protein [Candidatus Roizmanbacteria bacterium]|nr:prepilin-type N-terminal cleavage/methylation domain-containing protein [Candidatus Roizmanbacteria bacterium]